VIAPGFQPQPYPLAVTITTGEAPNQVRTHALIIGWVTDPAGVLMPVAVRKRGGGGPFPLTDLDLITHWKVEHPPEPD
jgi:hypothetical protein